MRKPPPSLAALGAHGRTQLLLFSLLFPCLPAHANAQAIKLPSSGSAYALSRGPSLTLSLRRVIDGSATTRFVLDEKTPGAKVVQVAISAGIRYQQVSTMKDPKLGDIDIKTELDVLGPFTDGSYDILGRVTQLNKELQVASIGIELDAENVAGEQAVMIPAFSGGEFVEPAATIPLNEPIDTHVACSVQATTYYGDDGSGLLLYAKDIAGTKPKHFIYQSTAGAASLRYALEFYAPVKQGGGNTAETLAPIHLLPYTFDPKLESGWYVAAKLYRSFLEKNAQQSGGILEKGSLLTREDIPKWMKELDLLISEQWGWYLTESPELTPLFHLRRLKKDLHVDNMLVGLWFSGDQNSPLGRYGSWVPHIGTAVQAQLLQPDSIRVIGYVAPGAFDTANPLLDAFGHRDYTIEDRLGKPQTYLAHTDPKTQLPNVHVRMDVAAKELAEWYWVMGAYHSTQSGYSGFYVDAPVAVGYEDFRRPKGMDLGTTEAAYKGFANVLTRTQEGANLFQRDWVHLHEAAFEWLIRCSAAEGATGVVGRHYSNDSRARGVPFFQCVYSGYTMFWPADEGYGTQTLAFMPEAYGDLNESNMSRLLAEGFTWGMIVNNSEIALPQGELFYEVETVEPLKGMFKHHKKVLKNLIDLRKKSRPWLVYGEMLNSPVAAGDMVDVTVTLLLNGKPSKEKFHKLAVPTTAWRAADDSVRLVVANGSRKEHAVTIDLARLGYSGKYELKDENSKAKWKPDDEKLSGTTFTIKVKGAKCMLLSFKAKK